MQDFSAVPAVAELAAMLRGNNKVWHDAQGINQLSPVALVVEYSVSMLQCWL